MMILLLYTSEHNICLILYCVKMVKHKTYVFQTPCFFKVSPIRTLKSWLYLKARKPVWFYPIEIPRVVEADCKFYEALASLHLKLFDTYYDMTFMDLKSLLSLKSCTIKAISTRDYNEM